MSWVILFFFRAQCQDLGSVFQNLEDEIFYKKISLLFSKVKYYVITSIIEVKVNYLYYINNSFGIRYYSNSVNRLTYLLSQSLSLYPYSLTLDLTRIISCVNIYSIIGKLNKELISFSIFQLPYILFVEWKKWIVGLLSFKLINKEAYVLIDQLVECLLLYCTYEILVMLNNELCSVFNTKKDLVIIYDKGSLLIVSKYPLQLYLWKKYLTYFLISNNVEVHNKFVASSSHVLKGMNFKTHLIYCGSRMFPYQLVLKPSLYFQFRLMQQISIILIKSRTSPIFLTIIRINKLLLNWSYYYRLLNVQKYFILLDYLIYMKSRILKTTDLTNQKISFFNRSKDLYSHFTYARKNYWNIGLVVYNKWFYKSYLVLKLVWLILL